MPIEARAGGTALSFSTAAELSRALLASLAEARRDGESGPRAGWDDVEPAWSWLGGLLSTRSDWHEAAGRALQHAVGGGDAVVKGAFVDAMSGLRSMVALLPWTRPLCATLGPLEGRHGRLPWNETPDKPRLDLVLEAQERWLKEQQAEESRLPLEGPAGPAASFFSLRGEPDLQEALARAARRGRCVKTEWGDGPAAWMHHAVLVQPWVDEALVRWVPLALERSDGERLLALEWLLDGRDLFRHLPLFEALRVKPRPWMTQMARRKAPAWVRPLRVPENGPATLAQLVAELHVTAAAQAASAPVLDLPASP
jgi:hypothetical protein